jgi:hypothetical protein
MRDTKKMWGRDEKDKDKEKEATFAVSRTPWTFWLQKEFRKREIVRMLTPPSPLSSPCVEFHPLPYRNLLPFIIIFYYFVKFHTNPDFLKFCQSSFLLSDATLLHDKRYLQFRSRNCWRAKPCYCLSDMTVAFTF